MNYLKILDVFIGNRCNLACHQCDTRSDIIRNTEKDPSLLSIFEGINLTRKNFHIETYSLLGGEPLLYLDKVEQVIKHIRSLDLSARIVIPTNGSLIKKHSDRLIKIISTWQVDLYVCNHYAAFDSQDLSEQVKKDTRDLAEQMSMTVFPLKVFLNKIFDLDNQRKDDNFAQWLDKRGAILIDSNESTFEEVYSNGNNYIWIRDQKDFHSNHYFNIQGKPLPFASGDHEQSYLNGCSSPCCNFLKDKKIYKCAALGTLKDFLNYHNSLEDSSWTKYMQYRPLNLETCNDNDIAEFNFNKFNAIPQCDMCPSNGNYIFTKTKEKVLPMKIYKE